MRVIRTKHGLRLSQHGVVVSELRTTPGPTHSVFDVLAALIVMLRPAGRTGVLGFAGGGMIAPLQALGFKADLATVDLDQASYDLFCRHCPSWRPGVHWERADAADWLKRQARKFDLLMDDLSIPQGGDVVKPEICWSVLPGLMRARLKPPGLAVFRLAVFNLMSPPGGSWRRGVATIRRGFRTAQLIQFKDYENRILIAGNELPAASLLGKQLQRALRQLRSRQAGRVWVRAI